MKKATAISTASILLLASCNSGYNVPHNLATTTRIQDPSTSAQIRDERLKSEQKIQLVASRIDELQKQICCISTQNVHGTWGGKVAPHHKNGAYFVTGDFLYWKATEDGLAYGIYSANGGSVPTSQMPALGYQIQSKLQEMHFEWDPGFRVGVGGEFSTYDHWDLFLNYSHLNNFAHGSTTVNTEINALTPTWGAYYLGLNTPEARAHWHLNFNTLDLELGRDYFAGKDLTIRPHIGLRGADIKQKYRATYDAALVAPGELNIFKAKNNYWGIGPRAGADLMWHFTKYWGIYGEFSGSLLYGQFRIKENLSQAFPIVGSSFVPSNISLKDTLWKTSVNVQGAIGFAWEEIIALGDFRISLRAVYELSEWFSQNRLTAMQISEAPGLPATTENMIEQQNGDLGFQGGTLRLIVDF